jgi:hypothetical protein
MPPTTVIAGGDPIGFHRQEAIEHHRRHRRDRRDRGADRSPVIPISHDCRTSSRSRTESKIMRLGKRVAVVTPQSHSMPEAVAIMTGATRVELERSVAKGDW